MLHVYASKVRAVLSVLASACIQGTVHSYQEQSRIQQYVYMFIYLYVYMFTCLYVYMFLCLYVYIIICLFVYMFIYLYVICYMLYVYMFMLRWLQGH